MSRVHMPPAESPDNEDYLSELFDRFQLRTPGRARTTQRRRSGSPRPAKGEDGDSLPDELSSVRRVEGIDWALIERLEQQEGREVDPDSAGAPGSAGPGKLPTAWVPPVGMARSKAGTGPSRYDPRAIGEIIETEVRDRDWQRPLSIGKVVGQWDQIVGDVVAQHCPVESFKDGKLVVQADSTLWAQQLKLLLPQVMRRIDEEVGPGVVDSVVVLPPRAPSWSHGGYRVAGRGPRDTYG